MVQGRKNAQKFYKRCVRYAYENIVDPYFCLHLSYVPFWSYAPFKTKFEYLVCKISQKVFKLEPSYLVHWLGQRRRLPGYILKTLCQILTKLLHFEIFTPFLIYLKKLTFCFWINVKTEASGNKISLHSNEINESYKLPV